MLRTRVLTALVLGPLVLLVAWLGEPWLTLGVGLVVVLALIEATDLLVAGGWAVPRVATIAAGLLVAFAVLIDLHYMGYCVGRAGIVCVFDAGAMPVAALTVAVVGLAGLALRHPEPRAGLGAWMASLFAVAWIGVLGPMIVAVGHLNPRDGMLDSPLGNVATWTSGTAWLFLLLGLVWSCDTGAYFVGRAIGRRKLHPQISPSKTVEGYVGGIVVAGVVTGILGWLLIGIAVPVAVGLGAVTAAVAQVGDLAKSLLKRAADRKDSGSLFPGHGGILDRIDSVLFAAPIVVGFAFLFGGMGLSP